MTSAYLEEPDPQVAAYGSPDNPPTIVAANSIPTSSAGHNSPDAKREPPPKVPARSGVSQGEQRDQGRSDAHTPRVSLFDPSLDVLACAVDDIETLRIALANRLRILTTTDPDSDGVTRGFGLDDTNPAVKALATQLAQLEALEHGAVLAMRRQFRTHPLHPWVKAQVGLGEKQVARLLSAIKDPYWNDLHNRPRTVSELWAFSGLHVLPARHETVAAHGSDAGGAACAGGDTNQAKLDAQCKTVGVAARRARGQQANWNGNARTRAYVIAESCIKQARSPYRAVYDAGRAKYADAVHKAACAPCKAKPGEPLTLGHQHARAMRLVMKAILRDLWIEAKRIHEAAS